MTHEIYVAQFLHESHGFVVPQTGISSFGAFKPDKAGVVARYAGTNTEWGGVIEASEKLGWTLHGFVDASATPSGTLSRDTFETIATSIVDGIGSEPSIHGVLLMLHGAMLADGFDDPEGELVRRVRAVVGRGVPIAVTLDLHANVSRALIGLANIVTSYRETPHVDMAETAYRAAVLLDRAIKGEIDPVCYLARRPMLFGLDSGRTIQGHGPMVDVLRAAGEAEKRTPGVLDISVNAGFYHADFVEAGPSVVVVGDGWNRDFQSTAEQLIEQAWHRRDELTIKYLGIDEALDEAVERAGSGKPVILCDYTDNAGGGAGNDGTALLEAMLRRRTRNSCVGLIWDAEAVAAAHEAGIDQRISVTVGGKVQPEFGGGPISFNARVLSLSDGKYTNKGPFGTGLHGDMGASALVECDGVKIALTSVKTCVEDREQFRVLGADPESFDVLVVKAGNHFRADFTPIAADIFVVDSGGIVSMDFRRFPYRKLPRPIWPLEDVPNAP